MLCSPFRDFPGRAFCVQIGHGVTVLREFGRLCPNWTQHLFKHIEKGAFGDHANIVAFELKLSGLLLFGAFSVLPDIYMVEVTLDKEIRVFRYGVLAVAAAVDNFLHGFPTKETSKRAGKNKGLTIARVIWVYIIIFWHDFRKTVILPFRRAQVFLLQLSVSDKPQKELRSAAADSIDTLRYIVSFAANDDSISNSEYEFIYQTAEAAIV